MKPIFQILINIMIFIAYSLVNFTGLFWYGKLPKVSIFHQGEYSFDNSQVFNNKEIQGQFYHPEKLKYDYFREVLLEISDNDKILNNYLMKDVPIYNGIEEIGTQTLYGALLDASRKLSS